MSACATHRREPFSVSTFASLSKNSALLAVHSSASPARTTTGKPLRTQVCVALIKFACWAAPNVRIVGRGAMYTAKATFYALLCVLTVVAQEASALFGYAKALLTVLVCAALLAGGGYGVMSGLGWANSDANPVHRALMRDVPQIQANLAAVHDTMNGGV